MGRAIQKAARGSLRYWGYCTRPDAIERYAIGFVLATSIREAKTKARRRVRHYTRRAYVWSDPEQATAPAIGRYYVERHRKVATP